MKENYYVDVSMLGNYFKGGIDDLSGFCMILQEIVGDTVNIVPIVKSLGGAYNKNDNIVYDRHWGEAIHRHTENYPELWRL